jgi:hypothetical protein
MRNLNGVLNARSWMVSKLELVEEPAMGSSNDPMITVLVLEEGPSQF